MGGVYLLARGDQQDVCRELLSRLLPSGRRASVFTKPNEFYAALRFSLPGELDYVMIDVRAFQLDAYNPYEDMASMPNPVPVVVYNDPYPEPDCRAAYWIAKNRNYLVPAVSEAALVALRDEFCLLEELLMEPSLARCVAAICPPEPFLRREAAAFPVSLDEIRDSCRIPPSRLRVLKALYDGGGSPVSASDLCIMLWNDDSEERLRNLYNYIHDIRKSLASFSGARVTVDRCGPRSYSMRISPA